MSLLLRASTAFLFVALMSGHLPLQSRHWRAVAGELARAQPEGRLKAQAFSLFHRGKG